ncbi:MAG: hypothetical protein K2Q18_18795 [Bdellovibrionales bacterium]|nr:hypothetical protein [Bdellovibrionales bacterium]
MNTPNIYAEFINNYDLESLIAIARNETLDQEKKEALIDALDTTLSYLMYEYDCNKISDIDTDYLEAVLTLGNLKGEKDYIGICEYYFILIELRKNASLSEIKEWLSLLEGNINEGLSQSPHIIRLTSVKIRYLNLLSESHSHADPLKVKLLFDTIQNAAKNFPNSDFWSTWIYNLVDLKKITSLETEEIVNQSLEDFNSTSVALYNSKELNPIDFYKQLGSYNFLKILPDKIKAKTSFWIHEAILMERPNLLSLSINHLRDQGILYINSFENHVTNTEVIEHAVALNTLSWERFSNWNSLLFYLKAKQHHALYLKKNGDTKGCLDIFHEAYHTAEKVRVSLDFYNRDNFSFSSPILEFYQQFALETPDENERKKLMQICLEVSKATIATGEGSYLFPYEQHLICASFLSLPEDFKFTWMQMCMVLCPYVESYEYWKNHDFVTKNTSLTKLLESSSVLFSESSTLNLHRYHKKYPVILHTLSEDELTSEFERLLNYAMK